MPGPRQPRLSWDALWSYANGRGIRTITDLAERSGLDVRYLYLFRQDGVNERAADRIAVGLGDVPETIWGVEYIEATAYLVAKADEEETAESERLAAEANRRRAMRAATKRRYRAENPGYAARQRALRKAAYEHGRDYETARQRRYYEENAEQERARSRAFHVRNRESELARAKKRYRRTAGKEREAG